MNTSDYPFWPLSRIGVIGPMLGIASLTQRRIILDSVLLDKIDVLEGKVLLVVNERETTLAVEDGPAAAAEISRLLAPFTRQSPISSREVYDDARRRIRARTEPRDKMPWDFALILGLDSVVVDDDGAGIRIGESFFGRDEVIQKAEDGDCLLLPDQSRIQAALVTLVVSAHFRPGGPEGYDSLERRVAAYEATQ